MPPQPRKAVPLKKSRHRKTYQYSSAYRSIPVRTRPQLKDIVDAIVFGLSLVVLLFGILLIAKGMGR